MNFRLNEIAGWYHPDDRHTENPCNTSAYFNYLHSHFATWVSLLYLNKPWLGCLGYSSWQGPYIVMTMWRLSISFANAVCLFCLQLKDCARTLHHHVTVLQICATWTVLHSPRLHVLFRSVAAVLLSITLTRVECARWWTANVRHGWWFNVTLSLSLSLSLTCLESCCETIYSNTFTRKARFPSHSCSQNS